MQHEQAPPTRGFFFGGKKLRRAKDRTGEENGLVRVMYRGIDDEDGFVVWVVSCACCPVSKFHVKGVELKETMSCGCLPPQTKRTRGRLVAPSMIENQLFTGLSANKSANPSELPLAA
jgi:hypothetical protein